MNTETDRNDATTERLSLGLRIPEQAPAPDDDFLTDPKRTETWFAALPLADIRGSALEVFNALVDCNRMEMPNLVRARVVEKFREPIDYLCRNLEKQYLGLGFPLSAKSRSTASLIRDLNAELAIGYKIVIEHMLRSDARRFDEKLMVAALHRAICYLSDVLYRSALVYEPWPSGVWRELHSIFAYAEQNRIHRVLVKDVLRASSSRGTTIENMYKRILLFATASVSQLRQSDIGLVYRECLAWANATEVAVLDETFETLGRFHFDVWGDIPPAHNALLPPAVNRRTKTFDVRSLIHDLKEQFDDIDQPAVQESGNGLPHSVLRQLVTAWGQPAKRRFVRTHLNFELHLTAGLKAVYTALCGHGQPQEPATSEPTTPFPNTPASSPRVPSWAAATTPTSLSLAPMEGDLGDDLVSDAPRRTKDRVRKSTEEPIEWPEKNNAPSPPHSQVSQTTNESAGGYCVRWSTNHPTKVNIGDIVGIGDSDGREIAISVIRWLKQDPSRELELGLEVISQRSRPAEHWLGSGATATRSDRARQPNILLPETKRGADDHSLITSSQDLQTDGLYWLHCGELERRIRIIRTIETRGNFNHYEFQLNNTDDDRAGDHDQAFSELWKRV